MLQDVLEWLAAPTRQKLVEQADKDGNSSLHFAASKDIWGKSLSTLFLEIVGWHIVYPFCILKVIGCSSLREGGGELSTNKNLTYGSN